MARVSITINGQNYDIACGDGEEQHILDLARILNAKVGELVTAVGHVGEARLLAMAGLLMADDLAEAKEELALARAKIETPSEQASLLNPQADEDKLADVLETMAGRIETIADGLENA